MSSVYDGIAGNLAFPGTVAISSSTNTTPITINTTTPHGMLSGDECTVSGHQTNTSANGAAQTITKTGASSFTLNGSAGIAAGVATGTVQPLTYGTQATIPSDGDPRVAASVNVPFELALDRSNKVLPAIGTSKVAGRVVLTNGFGPANTWAHIAAGAVAANSWGSMLNDHALTVAQALGSLSVISAGPGGGAFALFAVGGLLPADNVLISLDFNFVSDPGTGVSLSTFFGLFYEFVVPGGTAPTSLTGMTLLTGATRWGPNNSALPSGSLRSCAWLVSTGGQGTLYLAPAIYNRSSGTINPITQFQDDAVFVVEAHRPTGVPQ